MFFIGNRNFSSPRNRCSECCHWRRRQGGWGAAALPSLENLQKSPIIGQKIGLKSGKIFVKNGSFIGQAP